MDRRDRRPQLGRDPRDGDAEASLIYGVHPVTECLENRPGEVERVFVQRGGGGRLGRVLRAARDYGIPVSHLPAEVLSRKVGRNARHQGVAAQVAPLAYRTVEEVLAAAGPAGIVILCDGVEDAGNLGAILRSAVGAGVRGVILAADGTAGLSAGAVRASAGAALRIPVARVGRPAALVRKWVASGGRAVLLDPRGDLAWDRADLTGRLLVVAGGEARGVRHGVAVECNPKIAIPLIEIESLNVASAVSVLLFEAVRQRRTTP